MLTACGLWLITLGLYFVFVRPSLLPEDLRFMNTSLAQVRANAPGLEAWLQHVFTVMGGFMAGAGVLTLFVARAAMPSRVQATSWVRINQRAATVGTGDGGSWRVPFHMLRHVLDI